MEVKPGYKQTEVGVIPEDWEVKPLGTVAGYTNGKAHEGSISDFGRYVVVNSKFISTAGEVKKYSNQRFSPALKGEILMVMSDVPNGRAIARCFFVDRDDLYTVNQRICALRPLHVDGRLLLYRLNRNPFYLAFDDGVKQTNLRKDDVLSCPLALPSTKAEHEAIAEALSDADALIESLEQLLTKKRQIKKGAMQKLLAGEKRLPGFSGEWEGKQLGEFSEIIMGQSPSSAHYNNIGEGLPLIQGNADISGRQTIRRVFTTEVPKRGHAGDILMSVRAPVGEICRTNFEVCLGRGVCAIRCSKNDFLYYALISREPTWARLSKGSTFDSVSSTDVEKFEIEQPADETEQTAITTILSDMDAEITALEAKLSKAHLIKQGMMQELLTGRIRLL